MAHRGSLPEEGDERSFLRRRWYDEPNEGSMSEQTDPQLKIVEIENDLRNTVYQDEALFDDVFLQPAGELDHTPHTPPRRRGERPPKRPPKLRRDMGKYPLIESPTYVTPLHANISTKLQRQRRRDKIRVDKLKKSQQYHAQRREQSIRRRPERGNPEPIQHQVHRGPTIRRPLMQEFEQLQQQLSQRGPTIRGRPAMPRHGIIQDNPEQREQLILRRPEMQNPEQIPHTATRRDGQRPPIPPKPNWRNMRKAP